MPLRLRAVFLRVYLCLPVCLATLLLLIAPLRNSGGFECGVERRGVLCLTGDPALPKT
jgi:hypothetical protein